MTSSVTIINGLAGYQRIRLLPVNGKVRVNIGQSVTAATIVAEASVSPRVEVLDLRPVVGNASFSEIRKMIRRGVGEHVQKGDVIIATEERLNRILRATADGVIRSITSKQVLLEVRRPPFQLRAGYGGQISEIIPDRGVVIDLNGAMVQGAWGNGRLAYGKLVVASEHEEQVLEAADLTADCVDAIVLAGRISDANVLKTAQLLPVRGLILGSMSARLIDVARRVPFPVMLVNGFGPTGMDVIADKLLRSNQGRKVALNAQRWDRSAGHRPEAFIEITSRQRPILQPATIFDVGRKVRINTMPYMGYTGIIERMRDGKSLLPSGILAEAVDIRLETGQHILVPLKNVDMIE
ncbi:MAG: hypothetical protein JW750_10075 [Anaerolineaceae bacterium]|nr:hypothetical protein [Anaerolineaceae bacterium]